MNLAQLAEQRGRSQAMQSLLTGVLEIAYEVGGPEGGDTYFYCMAGGGYRLTPYDPEFAGKLDKAEGIMRRYRNTLNALAK
jgi:hypothetical protein